MSDKCHCEGAGDCREVMLQGGPRNGKVCKQGLKPVVEFCLKCGASFPPREGEGICKEWLKCYEKQTGDHHPTCKCEDCRFWGN